MLSLYTRQSVRWIIPERGLHSRHHIWYLCTLILSRASSFGFWLCKMHSVDFYQGRDSRPQKSDNLSFSNKQKWWNRLMPLWWWWFPWIIDESITQNSLHLLSQVHGKDRPTHATHTPFLRCVSRCECTLDRQYNTSTSIICIHLPCLLSKYLF